MICLSFERSKVKSCTPHVSILDSTLSHLDSAFWLDSTRKLYSAFAAFHLSKLARCIAIFIVVPFHHAYLL